MREEELFHQYLCASTRGQERIQLADPLAKAFALVASRCTKCFIGKCHNKDSGAGTDLRVGILHSGWETCSFVLLPPTCQSWKTRTGCWNGLVSPKQTRGVLAYNKETGRSIGDSQAGALGFAIMASYGPTGRGHGSVGISMLSVAFGPTAHRQKMPVASPLSEHRAVLVNATIFLVGGSSSSNKETI